MALFKRRIHKREETADPADMVSDVLLRAMLRDEPVTREMAMTVPAVSQCVDYISGAIATMPVKLYRVIKGKIYEQTNDTRVRLLNGDTGDTLDAFQLKKAMVSDYLMGSRGGGYAYIKRRGNEVTGLHYVENICVSFEKNYQPIYKDYNILVEGQTYYPWDFLKLVRNTVDGAEGVSLTAEVGKALEAAYETLAYQVAMLKTGGNKKGFIKSEKVLTQDAIDKLKTAWKKLYQNNTENVVVLNNGLDFKEASQTSVELQLNESKETFTSEILGIFHIYPGDESRTFKEAIYPIVKAFETAMNRDLLTEEEKRTGKYFFELDVKEIVRANLGERYQAYKMAKETGFMTLNEIRRAENMTEVDGLDVVNVGLGAVLYDTNKHVYYTPNTDTIGNVGDANEDIQKMIVSKEEMQAFDASGNSAEREMRFNPNHDNKGRFAPKNGGGGGGFSNKTVDFTDSKGHNIKAAQVSGEQFVSALKKAKASQPADKRWRVDDYSHGADDYDGMQAYATENGSTIAITKDGDIVSVATNADAPNKDSGRALMEFAVQNGGTKLDSYEGNHGFYTKMGFEPVSWTPFDEKYAPPGWEKGRDAAEAVIFYKYTGKVTTEPAKAFRIRVPASKDYDTAQAVRDNEVKKK